MKLTAEKIRTVFKCSHLCMDEALSCNDVSHHTADAKAILDYYGLSHLIAVRPADLEEEIIKILKEE